MSENLQQAAEARTASVIELAQQLIRRPSRAGIDDYGPVLGVLEDWLTASTLPHRRLHDAVGELVGLLVEIPGGQPGAWWTLDACVDTAPYGDETAWSFPPASGDIVDGWLLGRGSSDSKLAAAMFCHIAADLLPRAADLYGGLAVLLDVDEHTGGFGGARAYLAAPAAARPAGVMIGYPGLDEVVVGGRGLWRASLAVHAPSGHSGSSKTVVGAISRAAHLVRLLDTADLPGVDGASAFPLPPKLSVTSFHGGQGFSVTEWRSMGSATCAGPGSVGTGGRRRAGRPRGRGRLPGHREGASRRARGRTGGAVGRPDPVARLVLGGREWRAAAVRELVGDLDAAQAGIGEFEDPPLQVGVVAEVLEVLDGAAHDSCGGAAPARRKWRSTSSLCLRTVTVISAVRHAISSTLTNR